MALGVSPATASRKSTFLSKQSYVNNKSAVSVKLGRRDSQCRIIFANCIANLVICRHVGRLSRADTARSAEKGFALDPGAISLPGRSLFTVAFHALALRLWRAGAT